MIDLRDVKQMAPKHFLFDGKAEVIDFSCGEMKGIELKMGYQCTNKECRLVYNKFLFAGYYRNPNRPYPERNDPDNILSKARVCQPKCTLLKKNLYGYFSCTTCGGIFLKNKDINLLAVPNDWFVQDKDVLKYLLMLTTNSAQALRQRLANEPLTLEIIEMRKALDYKEADFMTNVLAHCLLE